MVAARHNLSRRAVLGAGAVATLAAVTGSDAASRNIAVPAVETPTPPVRPPALPRIDIVCGACGGNNVSRDAWAEWDTDEQDWVLGAVFDYGHCHDCDGEARLEEIELPSALSETREPTGN